MKGFSLIELVCTLTIVGLMICLVYPNYLTYITHAHRMEGQLTLLDLANYMEKHYLENGTYQSAKLPMQTENWYSFSITKATKQEYQLQAIAIGRQAIKDVFCKQLMLNNTGEKSSSDAFFHKTTSCWP